MSSVVEACRYGQLSSREVEDWLRAVNKTYSFREESDVKSEQEFYSVQYLRKLKCEVKALFQGDGLQILLGTKNTKLVGGVH